MKRTCLALFAFLVLASSALAGDIAVKQSIAFVQKLQTDGGGFMPQAGGMPSLRGTSAAVRAVHYFGGALKDKDACSKFVASCYDAESGGFSDVPKGKPGVFETAVGLMAVAELKMPMEKYVDGASKYLGANAKTFEEIRIAAAGFEAIQKKSARQKAWVAQTLAFELLDKKPANARDTASVVVTLLRLDHKPAAPEASIKILKAGQRQSGGWGKAPTTEDAVLEADLETSYRVMRCFVMLKARPDNVEGVRSFVAKCRNADGGYGVAPGQPSSVGGTYFASIITHWLKEMP
jgi:prenyltransferase beta subunit